MPTPQYRDLGPTQLLRAVPDPLGQNPYGQGNWTVTAGPQDLNCHVGQAEVYQISLDGPVGSQCSLYRGTRLWNNAIQGWQNSYDPVNPLYIRIGDYLYIHWKAAAAVWKPQPTAVFWLRYDINLPENRNPADVP